jgi:hypothetical protein
VIFQRIEYNNRRTNIVCKDKINTNKYNKNNGVTIPDQETEIVDVVIVIRYRLNWVGGGEGVWKVRVRVVGF